MDISKLEQILSKELGHDKWRIDSLSKLIQGLYLAKTTNVSMAIPIDWVVLSGRCSSSIQARAELLESIFAEVGIERFGGFLADREFIGKEWFA